MNILKKWFDEVENSDINVFRSSKSEFIIYNGFKITKTSDNKYKIQDVRLTDFYDEVKDSDYENMVNLGFIKGSNWIVYNRNIKRVQTYTKTIEKLYNDKRKYQSKIRTIKTRAFYEKKLRNCQANIHKNIDLLFLYKTRINQYKSRKTISNIKHINQINYE